MITGVMLYKQQMYIVDPQNKTAVKSKKLYLFGTISTVDYNLSGVSVTIYIRLS